MIRNYMRSSANRARQDSKAALYHQVFSSPNGQEVLRDLEQTFGIALKKSEDGRVDPHATLAAVGARSVIDHINFWRNRNVVD